VVGAPPGYDPPAPAQPAFERTAVFTKPEDGEEPRA